MKKTIFLSIITIALSSGIGMGHGLHIDVRLQSPVVIVTAGYSESQILAGGTVTIYSPADDALPFQSGITDMGGNFVFMPDRSGEWSFVADDKKGHIEKMTITLPDDFFSPARDDSMTPANVSSTEDDHSHNEIPLFYKVIFGLALIMGITGIFYGFRSNRTYKK